MTYEPRRLEFQSEPAWSKRAFCIGLSVGALFGAIAVLVTFDLVIDLAALCAAIR